MRTRRLSLIASLLAVTALIAACSSSAATTDPYQVLHDSAGASWSPVQVNLGIAVKDGSTTVTIDPSAFGVVVDRDAGTGALHASLPTGALGMDAATLAQLGVTGSSLDIDVLYDGKALYGRSPLFGTVLTMLLGSSGNLPSGDLTGWLRFGTKDDLAGLGSLAAGSGSVPSFAIPSAGDAASLKTVLEDAGVTLTYVATEQHAGADAYHLTAAVDATKLLASKALDSVSQTQRDQASAALKEVTITGDLWVDKASNHLVELDIHVVGTKDATKTADVTIKLGSPDGTISTTAPSSAVDIPIKTIIGNLMQMLGQGLTGA